MHASWLQKKHDGRAEAHPLKARDLLNDLCKNDLSEIYIYSFLFLKKKKIKRFFKKKKKTENEKRTRLYEIKA